MDTKKKGERTRPACGFRRLAEPKRGGFSLSSPKRRRGPGRGGRFSSLSPALSPLVPRRERGKKALSVLCRTLLASRHVDPRGSAFPVRNIDSAGQDARLYGRRDACRYSPNSLRFSSHDASTGRSGTLAPSIACSSAPALSGKPTWP